MTAPGGDELRAEYERLVRTHYGFVYRFLRWLHPAGAQPRT